MTLPNFHINRNILSAIIGVFLWIVLLFPAGLVLADVTIKIVIVNSFETERHDVPVLYYLPKGITKDDIIDTGPLESDYDVKEGLYYVHGTIELEPKESKTLELIIRDIWNVSEDEVAALKNAIDGKVNSIEDKAQKQLALILGERYKEQLDAIVEEQNDLALNVEKRMQAFVVNTQKLKALKEEIYSLDTIAELGRQEQETKPSVKLVIEAENSLNEEVIMPLEYYLPKEIIPEYILDTAGFEVKYEDTKSQFYLAGDINFGPFEKKQFTVEIKNIWYIDEGLLNRYIAEAKKVSEDLAEPSAAEMAKGLFSEIQTTAQQVIDSQGETESVVDYIATYRLNQERLELIKEDLENLRSLALKTQPEIPKESREPENIFGAIDQITRINLTDITENITEKIKKIGVWKVTLTVVIFVIVLTVIFFLMWFTQLKKEEKRVLKKLEDKKDVSQ